MSAPYFPVIDLPRRGDERGALVVAEAMADCPFEIRRVYWVFGTAEGVSRGFHAHHRTRQLAVCVSGSCDLRMNDGRETATIRLDSPDRALPIEPMVWHEMHNFSPDCVLLVMADAEYDEADYIRDFEAFTRYLTTV